MSGSTLKYTECLRDAQSVVDVLAGYDRHMTSIVVGTDEGRGSRFEMEGKLTIAQLSYRWESDDIKLLVTILKLPRITDWKIVNSAKDKRL